ncbi:MAG: DUF4179 domain-containing protein [Oscillospiraceae bacterium]|nr:DUF4179 domain-containing protein [Oscillospiraceae bacterium]
MKEIYQNMNTQIQPDEILIQKVMNQTVRKKSHIGRKIAVSLACVVLSAGSLSVMTHASENFRDMLWQISPRAGAIFSPVMKSCIDNGIEMTIEGVYINGDDAEFYITFQDLEENRVDETLDLFDSYTIIRPFAFDGSAYGCAKEGFDKETGKVRFHIYTSEPNAGNFWGDTLTFSVKTLLHGVQREEHVPVDIDLSQVNYHPETTSGEKFFENRGYGSGCNTPTEMPDISEINIMKPEFRKDLIQNIKLTGLAWENGWLHIQSCIENYNGDSCIFYTLEDKDGNQIENVSFNWREGSEEYTETLIKVNPEEVKNYKVYAEYRIGGEFIDGNWQVKFPLEQIE